MRQIVIRLISPQINALEVLDGDIIDGSFVPAESYRPVFDEHSFDYVRTSDLIATNAIIDVLDFPSYTKSMIAAGYIFRLVPNAMVFSLDDSNDK